MKIGIDISQIIYEGTGVATYTRELVKSLVKVGDKDEFVLFGSSLRLRRPLKEFLKGLPGENAKGKFSFLPPKLLEFLWNGVHLFPVENLVGEVDIFHSSDWLEPPTKKAKKVTTIHDLTIYKYPETFFARGGHDIVKNQKRKLFFTKQECDLIICVSETTKQDAMEILKIPEKKLKVIYEAPDSIYFPKNQEEVKKVKNKFGIHGDYLLCVGTREPRKNIDQVLMAFVEISRAYPELSLVIAGKYGWGDKKLKVKSEKLKVRILGFVEKEDLASLYSGAEAFVYPSLYEGFGLPILEAMACGCPVITSNIGSMRELAAGFSVLVDPQSTDSIAENILKLLKNNDLRQELKIKGLKRAGEFSWEKAALQTLEAYRGLLD